MSAPTHLRPISIAGFLALGLLAPMRAGADWPPVVQRIQVTGLHTASPCEKDSLRIVLSGTLPNSCWRLLRVEEIPLRCFAPCGPAYSVFVKAGPCEGSGEVCVEGPVPWRREFRVGPLPPGNYVLNASVRIATCEDSLPESPAQFASQPFTVRPEGLCGEAGSCVLSSWANRDPTGHCNARLDGEGRAMLRLSAYSNVALRAVQGRLFLSHGSLEVIGLTPIGAAAGMTLAWERTADGARFVMFSPTGAPIPAWTGGPTPPPVLEVVVGVREGHRAPPITYLREELLAADAEGHELGMCPTIALIALLGAGICAEPAICDANGDGRRSIGDLVTMLLCLSDGCADSARFDCDSDGGFDLDDVLCCARRLLSLGGSRPDPVRESAGRLEFGELRRTPAGWTLPVVLSGIANLGGARVTLGYPADRLRLTAVERRAGPAHWLPLFESGTGTASLGLLNLSPGQLGLTATDRLELELTFESGGGSAPGAIEVAEADFSDLGGTPVAIPLPTGVPLPVGLTLAAAQPNPFSATTRLVLALDRGADVDVTVHDVSGRRVATLWRGRLAAGQRALSWDGLEDSGVRARDGIYFVRAAGAGAVVSRKVALLTAR